MINSGNPLPGDSAVMNDSEAEKKAKAAAKAGKAAARQKTKDAKAAQARAASLATNVGPKAQAQAQAIAAALPPAQRPPQLIPQPNTANPYAASPAPDIDLSASAGFADPYSLPVGVAYSAPGLQLPMGQAWGGWQG